MQPNGASPQRGAAFLKGEGKTIKQPFSRDTVRLTAVQVAYWASFCAVMSYATVFLLSLGYSSAAAGAVIAAGNLAGILLQPLCAGLVPRAGSARTVVLGMALALAALAGALCLLGRLAPACAALIILMYGLLYTMQGLLNAIAMELSNAGRRVDYGFARGMGSMGYAVCSWAVGGITAAVGAGALPFVHLALLAALGLCMLLLPKAGGTAACGALPRQEGAFAVLKGDRAVTPVLLGCIALFMGYNLNITYMIQTVTARGGTSGDMGAIFAIAAVLELPAMTLAGRLLRSHSAGTLMFCSGLGLTAKSLAIAVTGTLAGLYAAQLLQPLGYALVIPCTVYYANRVFPPHRRLAGQTLMVAASTLGTVLSAALGGLLVDALGVRAMLLFAAAVTATGTLMLFLSARGRAMPDGE